MGVRRRPSWFPAGKVQVAVSHSSNPDDALALITRTVATDIDALVLTNEDLHARELLVHIADRARLAEQVIFLGQPFTPSDASDSLVMEAGAQGQALAGVGPLSDELWVNHLESLFRTSATLTASIESVDGISLDLSSRSGALPFFDGFAFDQATWRFLIRAIDREFPMFQDTVAELRGSARFLWLLDTGLLGWAHGVLSDEVRRRAEALLAQARTVDPNFSILVSARSLRLSWFYRGLLRGLSSPSHPVVLLTVDQGQQPVSADLESAGIFLFSLSGSHADRLSAGDAETAWYEAGRASDGVWLPHAERYLEGDESRLSEPAERYWRSWQRASTRLQSER